MTGVTSRVLTLLIVVVALIGLIDAAVASTWDLLAVFAAILVLGALALGRSWSRRPSVAVRGDLVRWMASRAADGGERIEDVVDRAISAFRAGLVTDADDDDAAIDETGR
jgi:hypothetical protein